jgi:DNA-binding NarL/FixJ family response regulator
MCALLADRHTSFAEGVRGLLETVFDAIYVVADAGSLSDGIRVIRPTLVVADVALAASDQISLLHELRESSPESALIVLTTHDEPSVANAVLSAGATGVVLKRCVARDLLYAVDKALRGERFVSPDIGYPDAGIPQNGLAGIDAKPRS